MKSILRLVLLLLVFSFNYSFTQTLHDIAVANFSFTPSDLTITVGDTVRWTNNGGTHSVQADDNSFSNGQPSSAAWVFIHVFDTEGDFRYYCRQHGGPNGDGMSGIIHVMSATDVSDNAIKLDFVLMQNYTNPFNPSTSIRYSIPKTSLVNLKVYDVLGKEVATLVNEEKPMGTYQINFDASSLASGIYFYKIQAGNFVQTKKMILLK